MSFVSVAYGSIDPDVVQKFFAKHLVSCDYFGYSVSVSGNTAVIGALGDDDKGSGSGSAFVFVRSGDTWTQQDKLLPEDGAAGDYFGNSVSVSGDTVVIGACGICELYEHNDKSSGFGSVYVFVRSGDVWMQQAKLVPEDGAAGDNFGSSVSVSGDTAVIGAWADDDQGESSGSAYVFVRSGNIWTQQDKLLPEDGAVGDWFGGSVSVSGDMAVIGASRDDDQGESSGSAYVFVRSGNIWTQQDRFVPGDGAAWDKFGGSVSVSGDTAVIGASGSAYIFVRSGDIWTEQAKLVAAGDNFGNSVSVSGDTAVIGANYDDDKGSDSGSAYVFARGGDVWTEQDKLVPEDGAAGDYFGWSVSVSGDTAVIGAFADDDKGFYSGSAYVFGTKRVNLAPIFQLLLFK
ncbi:MAG: FG-GAP repeat protein [Candidatus Electrothrix sp. YB6]